jgi:hypothetical protein
VTLQEIFKKCQKISLSKRQDYTSSTDSHENFKRSAAVASWFKSDQDKVYAVLVATKLARLGNLLDTKEPNNESIDDTFLDLVNYCALWAERRTEKE